MVQSKELTHFFEKADLIKKCPLQKRGRSIFETSCTKNKTWKE